jgi:hypothetical protein
MRRLRELLSVVGTPIADPSEGSYTQRNHTPIRCLKLVAWGVITANWLPVQILDWKLRPGRERYLDGHQGYQCLHRWHLRHSKVWQIYHSFGVAMFVYMLVPTFAMIGIRDLVLLGIAAD